jgi:hypothetical protein
MSKTDQSDHKETRKIYISVFFRHNILSHTMSDENINITG